MACSTPEALGGFGAPCALATDCAEGLVCITQADTQRVCCGVDSGTGCASALASIQSIEEAGAASDTGTQGSGPNGGAASDAQSSTGDTSPDAAAGGMLDATATDGSGAAEGATAGEAAAPSLDGAGADTGAPADAAAGEGDASSD